MAWVRTDDRYDDTRKIKRAWRRCRATVGLHAMAKSYCARHETDGVIDLDWLEDRLPDDEERQQVIAVMLDVGLFEHLPAGECQKVVVLRVKKGKEIKIRVTLGPFDDDVYIVHDYLEFNEARQEAEERRRLDAERKTKERAKRRGDNQQNDTDVSEDCPSGLQEDSEESHAGLHAVSTSPDPTRPDPTRPISQSLDMPPNPPKGGRQRDREKWEEEFTAWVQAHPVTEELAAEWEDIEARVAEAIGDDISAFRTNRLHPHLSTDKTLLLGAGHPMATWAEDRYGRFLRQLTGRGVRVIDCGCERAMDQAA